MRRPAAAVDLRAGQCTPEPTLHASQTARQLQNMYCERLNAGCIPLSQPDAIPECHTSLGLRCSHQACQANCTVILLLSRIPQASQGTPGSPPSRAGPSSRCPEICVPVRVTGGSERDVNLAVEVLLGADLHSQFANLILKVVGGLLAASLNSLGGLGAVRQEVSGPVQHSCDACSPGRCCSVPGRHVRVMLGWVSEAMCYTGLVMGCDS